MGKKIEIVFLPAENGDCILIKIGDPFDTSILIDGGTSSTYSYLHKELSELYEKCPRNYIFLTHCHDDHIGGLLEFFEKDTSLFKHITTLFYNFPSELERNHSNVENHIQEPKIIKNDSGNLSTDQLYSFTDLLKKSGIKVVSNVYADYKFPEDKNFSITILTPIRETLDCFDTWNENNSGLLSQNSDWNVLVSKLIKYKDKTDRSAINASSISFLLRYNSKNYLFLADALASDIYTALKKIGYSEEKKLNASLVKVSHHGSKNNTTNQLLNLISSQRFVISTNGKKFNHPDKESLAKIILHNQNACLMFNYKLDFDKLFSEQDQQDYPKFSYQVIKEGIIE